MILNLTTNFGHNDNYNNNLRFTETIHALLSPLPMIVKKDTTNINIHTWSISAIPKTFSKYKLSTKYIPYTLCINTAPCGNERAHRLVLLCINFYHPQFLKEDRKKVVKENA